MKNILTAILISFLLVFIYSAISFIISMFLLGPNAILGWRPGFLLAPLSLPATLFESVAHDSLYMTILSSPILSFLLRIFFFFCNALLYAVPVYLLLKLFRSKKPE